MEIIKGKIGILPKPKFKFKPKHKLNNSVKALLNNSQNKKSTGYKVFAYKDPALEYIELVKLSKKNMNIHDKHMYRIRLSNFKSRYPTYPVIKWVEQEINRISSELSNESSEEAAAVLDNLHRSQDIAEKQGFHATISHPTIEHTTNVDLHGRDMSNLYGIAFPDENYINLNDNYLTTKALNNSTLTHETNHIFHALNPDILNDPEIQKTLNDAYLSNLSAIEKAATNALIRDYVINKGQDPATYEYIKVDPNGYVITIYDELFKDLNLNDVNTRSLNTATMDHLRNSKNRKEIIDKIDKLNEAIRIAVSTVPAIATAAWIAPWQENDEQITQYKMGGKLIPKHRFLKDGGAIAKGLDAWNAITINGTSYTLDGLKGDTFTFKDNKGNKILISKDNLKNYYLNLNYQNNEFYLKIKSDYGDHMRTGRLNDKGEDISFKLGHRYNFTDKMYKYIENPKITKQKERKAKQEERKAKRKLNSLSVRDKVYQKKQEAQSTIATPQTKSEIEDEDLAE